MVSKMSDYRDTETVRKAVEIAMAIQPGFRV